MFEIQQQQYDGIRVALLTGWLNRETVTVFETWSSSHDAGSVRRIILDFSQLVYLSSAGLRAILNTYRHTEKSGTSLLFCGLCGIVREVFQTSGLIPHLKIYQNLDEALKASQEDLPLTNQ